MSAQPSFRSANLSFVDPGSCRSFSSGNTAMHCSDSALVRHRNRYCRTNKDAKSLEGCRWRRQPEFWACLIRAEDFVINKWHGVISEITLPPHAARHGCAAQP